MNKSWPNPSIRNWIPALLLCTTIFWFSHQPKANLAPAQPSAFIATSSRTIWGLVAIDWDTFAGKIAHLVVFGILTILIWQIIPNWRIVISVTIIYACLDEFHQLFIPGRTARISDVIIDCAGAIIVLGWLSWRSHFADTISTVGNKEKGNS